MDRAIRTHGFLLLAAAVLLTAACAIAEEEGHAAAQSAAVEGTWRVVQIDVITDRGANSYPDPAPGLFIFGERYYSMVWMPLTEAPSDFAETWRPTDEERAAAFSSIIVNAGTYSITDSTLTTFPIVAKTPEFIGGTAIYDYSISGDTLRVEMTDALSRDGVRDPGVGRISIPMTLVRVE